MTGKKLCQRVNSHCQAMGAYIFLSVFSKRFMVILYYSNNGKANDLVKPPFSNFAKLRRNRILLPNLNL